MMLNKYREFPATLKSLCCIIVMAYCVGGCVNTGAIADALGTVIINSDDPATIKDGVPAYLIMLDTLMRRSPNNADLRLAAAKLQGAYATAFITEPTRAQLFAQKAYDNARLAFCGELRHLCQSLTAPQAEFEQALTTVTKKTDLPWLFGFASAWAGLIQANASDWLAVADLPKVEAMIDRVLTIDDSFEQGAPHLYMGVLKTLRPAALGGQPEKGRTHFERAVELSDDKNLIVKVFFAEKYARLVFDKELHDRLLNEVLQADPNAEGFTLSNVLAQGRAKALLVSGADYF